MNSIIKNNSTKIIGLFIALCLVIVPLVYSNKTVDITLVPQFFVFSIILFVFIILFYLFGIQRTYSFPINPITIALVCYFLFSITSLIGAVNKLEGLFDLMKIAEWIIFILILVQLINTKKETHDIIFKTFTIASFVLAFIGISQIMGIAFTKLPGQLVPYGTLGNRNIFVPSLLMTLPFAICQIIISQKENWKLFAIISALLNFFVVLISSMRTAWIALAIALLVVGTIIILFNVKYSLGVIPSRIKALKIAILIFIFTGIASITILSVQSKGNKTKATNVMSMSSTNERTTLWKKSLQMFADHSINGVGAGNWRIILPEYNLTGLPREAIVGEMHYQRPENDFVWILAETGVAGFLSYASLFVFAFIYLLKILKNKEIISKQLTLVLISSLIVYAIIAFWGFPKERTYLTIELGVVLALIISDCITSNMIKSICIHPIFFILILSPLIYKGSKMYSGEIQTQKIIDARSTNQNELIIQYANKALEYGYTIDPTSTPITFYKGVANFTMNKMDSALADFELARKVHPFHLHILNNLAACYESKGEHEKAIECLNRAIQISPEFQDALINLSAAYYNTGNIYKARETILKCKTNLKNAELNKLNKLIEKRTNDSLIKVSADYFNAGNIQKAGETIGKCKNGNRIPKVKEIKEAIIGYKNDSILKLVKDYLKEDDIKLAEEALLKYHYIKSNSNYLELKKAVDKKIWEGREKKSIQ